MSITEQKLRQIFRDESENVNLTIEEKTRQIIEGKFAELSKPVGNKLLGTWGDGPSNKMVGGVAKGKTYKEMFHKDHLDAGGFDSLDEFLRAVRNKDFTKLNKSELNETVGSEGGFLLSEQYRAELLDLALESEIVRPRATVYTIKKGNSLTVPALGGMDRSTQGIFGVTAVWTGEGTEKTITDPIFRQISLKVNKLVCFTKTSDEWLTDSEIPLKETVGKPFALSIGYYADYAHLRGSGAGQPLGVINSNCCITQAAESGQDPSTIVAENCIEMLAHLLPQCYAKAVWVCNIDGLAQMFKLNLKLGTSAERIPIFKGTLGNFSLFGLPVIFTDKLPSLGSEGNLLLADFSFQALLLKDDLRIESSQHPDFRSDKTQWRAVLRIDSQPILNEYVTCKDGSHTMSCYVKLGDVA